MQMKLKLALVAFAAFAVSGCSTVQSIFGSHSAKEPQLRAAKGSDVQSAIARATDEGRRHLDKGETGLAIEDFQRALSLGHPTAPALNGMGVAFARLGRYELAQHYFQEAMAINPSDERYAANLARLNRSHAFAMRHDGDIARTALAAIERDQEEEAAALAADVEPRPGQLTRVAVREYKIHTVEPMSAPVARTASSSPKANPLVKVESGNSPTVGKGETGTAPAGVRDVGKTAELESRFKPVVRIEFGKTGSPEANVSRAVTVTNPHLRQTTALDSRFKPLVRLNFSRISDAR